MEDVGLLSTMLRSSNAVIRRDDKLISATQIWEQASALSDRLQPFCGGRVAVLSPYVDHIAVALAAGELADCSIVLHRANELPNRLINQWNISAIVDSALDVRASGAPYAKSAAYVYIPTSGTTGEPKLVQQTMRALLGRIRRQDISDERPGIERASNARARWLFTYHPATFGGLQVLLTALQDTADLISVSTPSISGLRDAALEHQVTHISGTPTFWRAFVLALGDRTAELKLRQITLGGEIANESILQTLRAKFPDAQIRHIYASTEAGALFSVRDGKAGFPAEWLTTGVDGVQLRIQDNILQVKSPRAMVGYAATGDATRPNTTEHATPAASVITDELADDRRSGRASRR